MRRIHRGVLTTFIWALAQAGLATLGSIEALAYPGFVGFGYTSCTTCHYNPFGYGPLTDYGRALGATEISGRISRTTSDEEVGAQSGFLGTVEFPSWLRLAADYRGMYLVSGLETNARTRYINMQAEGSVILKANKDQLYAVATLGYVPIPESASTTQSVNEAHLISREHYVAFRPIKSWGLFAGFMDPVFGIRVVEHVSFIRSRTLLDINDQTHGLLIHGVGKRWETGLQLIAGNLFQEASVRQKGFTGVFNFDVMEKFRLGASFLNTQNDFRDRRMGALQSTLGMGKGSSLIGQFGLAQEKPLNQASKMGNFLFLQTMSRMYQGLYLLLTFEHFAEDLTRDGARYYQAGPAIDYFPFQRVELRLDFQGTRVVGTGFPSRDLFRLFSQVHIWL